MIEIVVRGLPMPQGNAKAFVVGKRAIVATGVKLSTPLGQWRAAIANEARAVVHDSPVLEGPLVVRIALTFPRPKSHYLAETKTRPGGAIRLDAPTWMTTPPDIDKLTRACLDALTAVVWRDDAQVVKTVVGKRYETASDHPGARIRIEEAPDD